MDEPSDCCLFKAIIFKKDLQNLLEYHTIAEDKQIIPLEDIRARENNPNCEVEGQKLYKSINAHPPSEMTTSLLWKCILSQFKNELIICYLLKQAELLLRVALSFFISKIFDSFEQNDKRFCFIYAGITGAIWISMGIFDQNAWRRIEQNSLKIKGSLTYSVYQKILSLSIFNLSGNESGEIINSITEFHDILQAETIYIFTCLSAPLSLFRLTALLVYQIGWLAIAGVSLSILFEFIHYHYANYNIRFYGDLCKFKDERIQILTDVISAFRYIKMQIWESFFIGKINRIREQEMTGLLKYGAGRSLQIALSEGISTASMLLIIGTTARINNNLTSNTIIQSILTILLIKLIIIYSSYGISCYYQINSIMDRVASVFAKQPLKPVQQQGQDNHPRSMIVLEDVWCSYNEDVQNTYILKEMSLSIKAGQFIGLFGQVGEGKSTFLTVLSKQMPYIKGQIKMQQIASFQQSQPSLFTGTIEDNILFGKQMDRQLYQKSIKYSCLDSDLASMPLGDQSIIQEGAVNLSGGQRTRLCLARVIYSDQPIILLDDPLSSLDMRVVEKIMQNLVTLNKDQGKTLILATHQIHCLVKCDHCYEIKDKKIRLIDEDDFSTMKQKYSDLEKDAQINQKRFNNIGERQCLKGSKIIFLPAIDKYHNPPNVDQQKINIPKRGFLVKLISYVFQNKWNYLVFPMTLLFYTVSQTIYGILILLLNGFDQVQAGTHAVFKEQHRFWMALGLMSASIFICQITRTFLLNLTIQLANSALHEKALNHLFKANVIELDNLGTKGILDKFSTDLGLLDVGLLQSLSSFFINSFISIVQMIIIATVNPIILAFAFGIIIPLSIWYSYCFKVISVLKQLDLNEKGPVIGLFSQTLNGLMQIKNMRAEEYMKNKLNKVLNDSILQGVNFRKILRVYTSFNTYYTTLVIVGGYFALIATNNSSNFGSFTFAAVFLVQINQCIIWVTSFATKINSTLISVDRILGLGEIKPQNIGPLITSKQGYIGRTAQLNPSLETLQMAEEIQENQAIVLRNLCLRYGREKNLALKNISLTVRKGEKIALIGRTGSGKSSIIQALYRLIEPQLDTIYLIQGENALNLGMQNLRSKFTCIPQVPFVFADKLRNNLDPHGKFSDQEIIQVLKKVQIYDFVQKFEEGLDVSLVSEKLTLSAGQKQLICLARAILEKKNFLVLDEATSNIDHQTDSIIQELIRKEFVGKTIIVVAHRLQTILDFDQILVLAKGQVIQKGSAKELYRKKGQFYGMINDSGKQKYQLIKSLEQLK